jgi:hypothetical protein
MSNSLSQSAAGDAPDEASSERRVEHVRILGQADTQRLRVRADDRQQRAYDNQRAATKAVGHGGSPQFDEGRAQHIRSAAGAKSA